MFLYTQIVNVNASQASMYGTKVEIKLRKAEPGSWARLDVPKAQVANKPTKLENKVDSMTTQIDSVDLSDL